AAGPGVFAAVSDYLSKRSRPGVEHLSRVSRQGRAGNVRDRPKRKHHAGVRWPGGRGSTDEHDRWPAGQGGPVSPEAGVLVGIAVAVLAVFLVTRPFRERATETQSDETTLSNLLAEQE